MPPTPTISIDIDALAHLREDTRYHREPARRPVYGKVNVDDHPIAVALPGRAVLADLVRLDGLDAFRSGASVLVRRSGSDEEPVPVDIGDLADALLRALRELPERRDALRPYRDLRRAADMAEHGSIVAADYCLSVVRAWRASLPTPPAKPKPVSTKPAQTVRERVAEHRARRRLAEKVSSAYWLGLYLDDDEEPVEPGVTVLGAELYDLAVEALEDFAEDEETTDDGTPLVVPGQRTFYAVADDVLGKRRRTKNGVAYTIPNDLEVTVTVAEAILNRAARMLLEENREAIESLIAGEQPAIPERPVRHLRAVGND